MVATLGWSEIHSLKAVVYGVLSHGLECENPNVNYPDVYTNVTYYIPWILDNMN